MLTKKEIKIIIKHIVPKNKLTDGDIKYFKRFLITLVGDYVLTNGNFVPVMLNTRAVFFKKINNIFYIKYDTYNASDYIVFNFGRYVKLKKLKNE